MSPSQRQREHFQASADVLTRLGAELITDNTQALLELIKNGYDADAQSVVVTIDTSGEYEIGEQTHRGRVEVRDTGHGMDYDAIVNGWLMLSASPKRAFKDAGRKTTRGRIPLGDKGLGRLGAQRLGEAIVMRTRPPRPAGELPEDAKDPEHWPDTEHRVSFRFSDFTPDVLLENVDVAYEPRTVEPAEDDSTWPLRTRWGTVIELYGLRDPDLWRETARVETELSKVVNPFTGIDRFTVSVRVDDQSLDLGRIGADVRRAAMTTWKATFDGEKISIEGRVRPQFFRLRERQRQEQLEDLLRQDGGDGLIQSLQATKSLGKFSPVPAAEPHLVQLTFEEEVTNLGRGPDFDHRWLHSASPGPFVLELDTVHLELKVMRTADLHLFDKQKDYRDWVRERAGIGIYRDGFRVAAGEDLLKLGREFSRGGSFYGLRPANVLGYVAITAEHNARLDETTDREGLRATVVSRTFFGLLGVIRDRINSALEDLGRAAASYVDDHRRAATDTAAPLEELIDKTRVAAKRASEFSQTIAETSQELREVASNPALLEHPRLAAEVAETAEVLAQTRFDLDQVKRMSVLVDAIADEVQSLSDQFEETYELIGVGLTAEALAHELTHIVSRLSERSGAIRPIVAAISDPDPELTLFVEEVEGIARSLRAQLRHLNPQLRYARERREQVDLAELTRDVFEYHRERLRDEPVDLSVTADNPAKVKIVPGRFLQVIDNLVLNAEFWVRESLERGDISRGEIAAHVAGATVAITDNGPGVPPALVPTIFEPFETGKASGRGLGLFICRQLLAAEEGTITLKAQRKGNPRTFEVNLDARRPGG